MSRTEISQIKRKRIFERDKSMCQMCGKELTMDLIMGGKSSQAYKDNSLRGKIYSDIQREVKRQFGLQRSYKALKSRQKDAAIEIIEKYIAPMVLQDEIALLNNQFSFDKSI